MTCPGSLLRPLKSLFAAALFAGALFSGVAGAAAGDGTVVLSQPAAAGPGLAAFPRIEAAGGSNATPAAIERINAALDKADTRLRTAAADCRAEAGTGDGAGWQRTVEVATAGPDYLAVVARDDLFCGGAHPTTGTFALAFDLTTGSPLNWARLLPAALAGTASLDSAPDGTRLGVLTGPALTRAYLAGYGAAAKPVLDAGTIAACREGAFDPQVSFVLWPSARPAGLAIVPENLPHVVAACAVPVVLSPKTLAGLGVSPAFATRLSQARP